MPAWISCHESQQHEFGEFLHDPRRKPRRVPRLGRCEVRAIISTRDLNLCLRELPLKHLPHHSKMK
jgi:hypothetical protein